MKRENAECTIQGRICPEHRVKQKDYTVILRIDEKIDKIKSLACLDCAAAAGSTFFHHLISLLMLNTKFLFFVNSIKFIIFRRLQTWYCIFNVVQSTIRGTVSDASGVLLEEVATIRSWHSKKVHYYTRTTFEKKSSNADLGDNSTFLSEVMEIAKKNQVDSQLSRYNIDLSDRNVYKLSIHHLIVNFVRKNGSGDDFIEYAKTEMNDTLCSETEKKTRNQSSEILWYELRYGRISASNIFEASRCTTKNGSLVERIIGVSKLYDNIYMERGRRIEPLVIAAVEQKLKIKINKSGFFLMPSYPMLGASPDGIREDFVVEVKSPSSEKTTETYLPNGKISNKYKSQINLQMFLARKKKGLFCVADSKFERNKQFQHVLVEFDNDFTSKLIEKAVTFWKENIFSRLLQSIFS